MVSFSRASAQTTYSYDANSNLLTAEETQGADLDLEATFDQAGQGQSLNQSLNIEQGSNRLLGFTQTLTRTSNGQPVASNSATISYQLDANGAMTSDGLRDFQYDAANRLAKVRILKDGEAASVRYLHNALGQRTFKSEPQVEQTLPDEDKLGKDFISWLKERFNWLFASGNSGKTSLGEAFVYGDGEIPSWALIGSYDNGTATGKGRSEFIWLPTEDGQAIPIGLYKSGQLYAIHSDHLGTPRLITGSAKQAVWQWPYGTFGSNKPTGMLQAEVDKSGNQRLKGTTPVLDSALRFPGQYHDSETGLFYNYFRTYDPRIRAGYTQPDPIGLKGGLNRFAYAGANPIMAADPTGRNAAAARVFGGLALLGTTWWATQSTTSTGQAANDVLYDNVVDFFQWFCDPDDACKKNQDALLRERLLINGMFVLRLMDIADYRVRALAFNKKVEVHNRNCPNHMVGALPIGPQG